MLLMKKLLIIMVLLMGVSMHSQDFKNWSLELEYGNHYLNDRSAQSVQSFGETFTQIGILSRYNFNRTVGLGVKYNFNHLRLIAHDGTELSGDTNRLSLEAYVDLWDVVTLDKVSQYWTLLGHIGPGVIWVQDETVATMNGGLTLLRKISPHFAAKLDYSLTGLINQKRTWDGLYKATAEGITSQIHSFSLGLVWYPAVKKRKRDLPEHADWYMPETLCPADTTIVNNYVKNITQVTKVIKEGYKPIYREFVFFDHDKSKIRKSELNAIYQTYITLVGNPKRKVKVIGWASNTSSSAEYNQKLSEKRCEKVIIKLLDMGLSHKQILIDPNGKDYHLDDENVHDLARRVELLIIE